MSKFSIIILWVLGLGFLVEAAASEEKAREIVKDEAAWEALGRGEAIVLVDVEKESKEEKKHAFAGIVIAAPVQRVWEAVCDKESAPKYVKSLKRAKILERGVEEGVEYMLVEQDVRLGVFPKTFNYTMKHRKRPHDRIDFTRVSGDLKEVDGSWQFVSLAEGTKTLLLYRLRINPGILIPEAVVRSGMKKTLPEALRGVRQRVEDRAAQREAEESSPGTVR